MLQALLQTVGGLILLVFAGDFMVRGAVSMAERLGVPTLVIGLTVVAFGTSAPELVVAIDAVLVGAPTLALGNVVGSNIANILLVVGLPALVAPILCNGPRLNRNMFIMLGVTGVFIGLAFTGGFAPLQGFVLIAMLLGFLGYSALRAKASPELAAELADVEDLGDTEVSPWMAVGLVIAGLAGLLIGAHLLVEGSVTVARALGVSEAIIGLTLVALGTSLPELVTAVAATIRCQCDVAVGNVIGSNIFNLLAIIGFASLFGEIPVPESFLRIDLWVMLGASMVLIPFTLRRSQIGRFNGLIMLALYCAYIAWLVIDGNSMSHMAGL